MEGLDLDWIREDPARFWRRMTSDYQLRWVGPDKGVIHLATAAVVNAVWDLWAKSEGKPVWRLAADMSPAQIVGRKKVAASSRCFQVFCRLLLTWFQLTKLQAG